MSTQKETLKGYQKKLELIQQYHLKLASLKMERNALNRKINSLDNRMSNLMETDVDLSQLELFDNLDEFLNPIDKLEEENE